MVIRFLVSEGMKGAAIHQKTVGAVQHFVAFKHVQMG
jgi:hypothetical protein